MRSRVSLLLASLLLALPGFAVERWILISGTVGTFHTDARIFNPSFEKDITISATFLPTGNTSNAGAQPVTLTIPKRQMRILDDVTTQLFNSTSLGAIRLVSDDEFEATSRIYSQQANGTLGQFGPGMPTASAKNKGAILQMKANGSRGQNGTFRTNVGVVNPTGNTVTVTWVLYDKNNAVVGPAGTTTLQPFGVVAPSPVAAFFAANTADLSDAWVSYTATEPIFVYGSVLDNGTEDQTFVPAVDDKGVPPAVQQPIMKTFTVSLQDFSISIVPPLNGIKKGDVVEFNIINRGGEHGFQVVGPGGQNLVPDTGVVPTGANGIRRSFTVGSDGTYFYFCTRPTCGTGHNSMAGDFSVGLDEDPNYPGGRGY